MLSQVQMFVRLLIIDGFRKVLDGITNEIHPKVTSHDVQWRFQKVSFARNYKVFGAVVFSLSSFCNQLPGFGKNDSALYSLVVFVMVFGEKQREKNPRRKKVISHPKGARWQKEASNDLNISVSKISRAQFLQPFIVKMFFFPQNYGFSCFFCWRLESCARGFVDPETFVLFKRRMFKGSLLSNTCPNRKRLFSHFQFFSMQKIFTVAAMPFLRLLDSVLIVCVF